LKYYPEIDFYFLLKYPSIIPLNNLNNIGNTKIKLDENSSFGSHLFFNSTNPKKSSKIHHRKKKSHNNSTELEKTSLVRNDKKIHKIESDSGKV
jgi:hypothetical protein